jgi:hypothetical protein
MLVIVLGRLVEELCDTCPRTSLTREPAPAVAARLRDHQVEVGEEAGWGGEDTAADTRACAAAGAILL